MTEWGPGRMGGRGPFFLLAGNHQPPMNTEKKEKVARADRSRAFPSAMRTDLTLPLSSPSGWPSVVKSLSSPAGTPFSLAAGSGRISPWQGRKAAIQAPRHDPQADRRQRLHLLDPPDRLLLLRGLGRAGIGGRTRLITRRSPLPEAGRRGRGISRGHSPGRIRARIS